MKKVFNTTILLVLDKNISIKWLKSNLFIGMLISQIFYKNLHPLENHPKPKMLFKSVSACT